MRTFIICFLLFLTAGCVGPMNDWPNVQSGAKTAEPVILAIQAYRTTHGKYPESLDALNLPEKVMEDVRNRKLHYLLQKNGSNAGVSFRPFGGIPAFCYARNDIDWKWECMGK